MSSCFPVSLKTTKGSTSTNARPPVSRPEYTDWWRCSCSFTARFGGGLMSSPFFWEVGTWSLNLCSSFRFTFCFRTFNKFQVNFMYKGVMAHITVANFASILTIAFTQTMTTRPKVENATRAQSMPPHIYQNLAWISLHTILHYLPHNLTRI